MQAEGLAEWGGQGYPTLLRKGLEGARQVHLERGKCLRPAPPVPLGWGWNPGWHLEALAHCPAQPGTQATAGQHAACRLSRRARLACPAPPPPKGRYGCSELPSPAQGPGKREGILGGAVGPQPSQPRILALKGMLDTEGAARPALDLDLATAWAAVILGLDQGQDLAVVVGDSHPKGPTCLERRWGLTDS